MPVIPALRKAETRGWQVQVLPGKLARLCLKVRKKILRSRRGRAGDVAQW